MNVYGTWSVTTEGDCEGKSVSRLGSYEGYIDEIALHLAEKCYYTLNFKPIENIRGEFKPTKTDVSISLDLKDYSVDEIKKIFSSRPVKVERGCYYKSYIITSNNADEIKREKALSKLTVEEKRLLGL